MRIDGTLRWLPGPQSGDFQVNRGSAPDGGHGRPLTESERRDFWEICEDRYQVRSLIMTSQLPVARWHEQIGDPTAADGILDRIVHNSHRIELRGDSMRKPRGEKTER